MNNLVTEIGVGGIFALLVLKGVFEFLQQRKTNGGNSSVYHKIADLWEWHRPQGGKFLWYESSDELTGAVKELKDEIRLLRRDIGKLSG